MAKVDHSDKWSSCVHKVDRKGGPYNPYAVCTTSVGHQCERELPFVSAFAPKKKESIGSSAMPQVTRGGVKRV